MKKIDADSALLDEALKLLDSPRFFIHLLHAIEKSGLVGEKENALVVYVVATSRLLDHPVNLFVKGASSSGKNYLVKKVLQFFSKTSVVEISSSSGTSWNYQGNNLQHRIVYIQEQNKATGTVHPARLLISENELIRMVTVRSGSSFETKREVTKGPVACISTTTKTRVEIDDETRHISIFIDDSPEQTRRIVEAGLNLTAGIDEHELAVWEKVQDIIARRARLPIRLGNWSKRLADEVWTGDVRVRRYFAAFMEVCKAVCLIRSFRFPTVEVIGRGEMEVGFRDFAIASLIFETALSQSLSYVDDEDRQLHKALTQISMRKKGVGVTAQELAPVLNISKETAYARLRQAIRKRTVVRSNSPGRGNLKQYLPAKRIRMLPNPRDLFRKFWPGRQLKFIHPITGEIVTYGEEEEE